MKEIKFVNKDDPRVEFANHICKMIFNKNDGDIDKCMKDIIIVYKHFFENVKNIYQFVECNIPMFFLCELKNNIIGVDYIKSEYNMEVKELTIIIENECKKFYK